MKINNKVLLLTSFFILLFFLHRSKIDFPVTLDEAKEGYTAYSIIKTGRDTNGEFPGLFFRTNNDFVSTLGVYLRILSVFIFGLTDIGVRLPAIIFGLITVYVFYRVSQKILKSQEKSIIATLLFLISPFFIQLNIFNLGLTLAILFILLTIFFQSRGQRKLFYMSSFFAILSSIFSTPFVLAILFYEYYQKENFKLFLSKASFIILLIIVVIQLNRGLVTFLVRKSIIEDVHPKSYTYVIDKKLSFGPAFSSPLIIDKFNFTRIAYNKLYFGTRELFKSIAAIFNFELLSSSFESQTILAKERIDSVVLPKVFFWEIPAIFLGLLLLIKKKSPELAVLSLGTLLSVFVFKEEALALSIPLIVFSKTIFLYWLKDTIRLTHFKIIIFSLVILLIASHANLIYHMRLSSEWISENDLRHYQIWNTLSDKEIKENKIIITDRLGEPINYYLYYKKVRPTFYINERNLGIVTDSGIQRINGMDNVEFRSFKYQEEPRGPNEIWVGMAGEFVGENRDFEEITTVNSGEIFKRVKKVKQGNKFIGDELWFVKTTFK